MFHNKFWTEQMLTFRLEEKVARNMKLAHWHFYNKQNKIGEKSLA